MYIANCSNCAFYMCSPAPTPPPTPPRKTSPLTKFFVNLDTCNDDKALAFVDNGLKHFRLQHAVGAWINIVIFFVLAHGASIPNPEGSGIGLAAFCMWTLSTFVQAIYMVFAAGMFMCSLLSFVHTNASCLVLWNYGWGYLSIVGLFSVGFHPVLLT
jgi:hypothetical protein